MKYLKRLVREFFVDLLFEEFFRKLFLEVDLPVHVLPGGTLFERKTPGAIGFDAFARAIVSSVEMDPENPILRKTLFDFKHIPDDPRFASYVQEDGDELVYRLDPGESIHVGIGVLMAMPFPMVQWVAPRSGLASKSKISFDNAPGTIDPDYRGEAGILLYNKGDQPFYLKKDMRIAQGLFQWTIIPNIIEVSTPEELGLTQRGAGGFGSTGQ